MNKANECTCPSGDGSLRHPCPAHPASVELAGVAANLTFINGRPAMCGCQVEYSSGGGEYSDVIYVTLCAKHSGSAILDLVATNRIALTPEYEGQWHADLYLDREIPLAKAEGATPAEAVLALMSAERIDPEQESVEQAGGDERAAFESRAEDAGSDISRDDFGNYVNVYVQTEWEGWQARAALAQPSPASDLDPLNLAPHAGAFNEAPDEALRPEQAEAERPELWAVHAQGPDELYAAFSREDAEKHAAELNALPMPEGIAVGAVVVPSPWPEAEHWKYLAEQEREHVDVARAGLTQPSPAQAEKAEAERPEIVATLFTPNEKVHDDIGFKAFAVAGDCDKDGGEFYDPEKLMTVAQHERIVGELRAVIAQLRQHKNDYMDSGQETYRALQNEIREREAEIARLDGLVSGRTAERDAALARVAELEKQQPVAWMHDQPNRVDVIHRDVKDLLQRVPGSSRGIYRPLDVSEHYTIPLYAAPVAQAQHSVPEGWVQSLPLKDHQPCKPNEDRANGYTIPIYSRPVLVEEALRKLRAVLCDPIGNVVIDGSDGDREEVQRALGMLAAAPGKEGV
ncbi:hypothetical protein [Pseudomonas aeruginosa]|uniref:hypothetical protein n=2 Tax=Pseudomonas aeruginosa TaxID=287 RepID=UPI0024AE8F48|nr:hypothetical protein [Pseudomonas aeruginosa]MDI7005080.1 hypothetical protein [Pseudomonas aeruginosa]